MARLSDSAARSMPPEAVVAAGLMTGQGLGRADLGRLAADEVADSLRPLLHGNALWQPASVDRHQAGRLRGDWSLTRPEWRRPDPIDPPTVEALAEGWQRAVPPPTVTHPPGYAMQRSLRVQVDTPGEARLLRTVGTLPGSPLGRDEDIVISPALRSDAGGLVRPLRWRWPMSVAVVDGPMAGRWLTDLRQSVHYGVIYTAEIIADPLTGPATGGSGPVDHEPEHEIVIADARHWTARWVEERLDHQEDLGPTGATCVIAVADRSPGNLLTKALVLHRPAIAVATGAVPGAWWYTLFHELSHDNPIDVAMAKADPASLVAVPESGVELTAAARWFYAAAEQDDFLAGLVDDVQQWDFTFERGGASNICRLSEAVETRTGSRPVVVDQGRPMEAAVAPPARVSPPRPARKRPARKRPAKKKATTKRAPRKGAARRGGVPGGGKRSGRPTARRPVTGPADGGRTPPQRRRPEPSRPRRPRQPARPGPAATPPSRRLVADFWPSVEPENGDPTPIRAALPPDTDLLLEVRIAIPEAGQPAADVEFPPVPTDRPSETLEVVATCERLWDVPQVQEISLPTAPDQLDEPSTSALFELTTPASGKVLEVDIVVFFRNRPLQAVILAAPVRTRPLRRDAPTIRAYTITGPDEPTPTASRVDASLDARGAELQDTAGNRLSLVDIKEILDDLEYLVSQQLGSTQAPTRLDDEGARKVLIQLARRGKQLADQLRTFGLHRKPEGSIDLLVNHGSKVLPIELAYDGRAPSPTAKLCAHVTDPDHHRDPKPCRSAASRICPYRFWGMRRVISRSVFAPAEGESPTIRRHGVVHPAPALYAATAIADEGTEPPLPSALLEQAVDELFGPVTRVTSWTKWRASIRARHPHLLVVLGHTDTEGGEVRLHIGTRSKLAQPDIDDDVILRSDDPPPILILMACSTAVLGGPFGTLPGAFAANGAGAVIGTLSRINGPQGAEAAAVLLRAIHDIGERHDRLSTAMTEARRALIARGLLVGLVLVSHGEIDVLVEPAG